MAKYEGWENWETWALWMWMSNDSRELSMWVRAAHHNSRGLKTALEDYFWAVHEETDYRHPILKEFASVSLSAIEWDEIADALIEKEEETYG